MIHSKKTIIALIIFAVLAVVVVLLERTPDRGVRVKPRARPIPVLKGDQIRRITLTAGGSAIALERSKGRWSLVSPVRFPADQRAVEAVIKKLVGLEFGDVVTERSGRHAEFQVDATQGVHVQVAKDGKLLADFFIGKAMNGFTMLRAAKDTKVYQAVGLLRSVFDKELRLWRDRSIIDFERNDARSLEVTTAAGTISLARKDAKDSWTVTEASSPVPKLDASTVTNLIATLHALRAYDFADQANIKQQALTKPDSTIVVGLRDKRRLTLTLARGDKDQFYALVDGTNQVYVLQKNTADRLILRPIDFRDKTILELDPAQITGLRITRLVDGKKTMARLTRAAEGWRIGGRAPKDAAKIDTAISSLAKLKAIGFARHSVGELGLQKPEWRLQISMADGKKTTVSVGSAPQDGAYGVQLQGNQDIFLQRKYLLDRFLLDPSTL